MPQIDTVTYLPIIGWSMLIITLGFIFFNMYLLFKQANKSKVISQWELYQLSRFFSTYKEIKELNALKELREASKLLQAAPKLEDAETRFRRAWEPIKKYFN